MDLFEFLLINISFLTSAFKVTHNVLWRIVQFKIIFVNIEKQKKLNY